MQFIHFSTRVFPKVVDRLIMVCTYSCYLSHSLAEMSWALHACDSIENILVQNVNFFAICLFQFYCCV